ncbi:MAG: hypothetical protein GF353_20595 [Candidatus Lokiarchaeota archaeon]|nr:hypothetical protein [Candidatus Lokiarchaeota archaeon]
MEFALMFNVLDGGVSEPIEWNKESLSPDKSIIVLDETSQAIWLWHGTKRGLVQRRTALRQAESLKGHGYTIGKSIIGRNIRTINEIDSRKVGRVPEETEKDSQLQEILSKDFKVVDNYVVTFSVGEFETQKTKPTPAKKPEPKKLEAPVVKPKPQVKPLEPTKKPSQATKEYPEPKKGASVESPTLEKEKPDEDLLSQARVAFVIRALLDHFDDIWVSKKKDGSYSIEMIDGPVCQFSIKDTSLNFTANSFSGISQDIKNGIKKKYAELSKLL